MGNKLTKTATIVVDRKQIRLIVSDILDKIPAHIAQYEICGSYRRGNATSKDIDIVILPAIETTNKTIAALKNIGFTGGSKWLYCAYPFNEHFVQVEIKIANTINYNAQLMWSTGSRDFNTAINIRARKRGMKRNPYGLWNEKELIANNEKDIFTALELPFIYPENRNNGLIIDPRNYTVVKIISSDGHTQYNVRIDSNSSAFWCDCKGFTYHQKCRHLKIAEEKFNHKK